MPFSLLVSLLQTASVARWFVLGIVIMLGPSGFAVAKEESHTSTADTANTKEPPLSQAAISAREDIAKILEGADFNRKVTKKSWRFKNREDMKQDEEIPDWFIGFIEFLEKYFGSGDANEPENQANIGMMIAKSIEFILWVVGISIVILVIYHYRDYLKDLIREAGEKKSVKRDTPTVLFGLDVTQESLPENVPEQVKRLWREGSTREAMGLLYRATLSCLIEEYQFQFPESATENECASIVQQSSQSDLKGYVQGLTRIWQRLAYGHRTPADDDVISLCDRWPEIFAHGR